MCNGFHPFWKRHVPKVYRAVISEADPSGTSAGIQVLSTLNQEVEPRALVAPIHLNISGVERKVKHGAAG
jgi:hypothetical protein